MAARHFRLLLLLESRGIIKNGNVNGVFAISLEYLQVSVTVCVLVDDIRIPVKGYAR